MWIYVFFTSRAVNQRRKLLLYITVPNMYKPLCSLLAINKLKVGCFVFQHTHLFSGFLVFRVVLSYTELTPAVFFLVFCFLQPFTFVRVSNPKADSMVRLCWPLVVKMTLSCLKSPFLVQEKTTAVAICLAQKIGSLLDGCPLVVCCSHCADFSISLN